ncbi:alpha-glucosidase C-terminal domain-containing protein [bacterium]|nr:alpha-glucosidase C-terminal domain-containing protein [bacterium]
MKKLIVSFLAVSILLNYSLPAMAFSTGFITNQKIIDIIQTENVVSKDVEKRLKDSISKVYGSKQTDEIYINVLKIIKESRLNREPRLKEDDLNRSNDWYKDEVIYMLYVDQFGVDDDMSPNTFFDSVKMLRYLKDLGVTTIYMLPFADSPMGDAGFDVRNPRDVRSDLGGMPEFIQFITEAKRRGFKLKSDLVLNHFSDQHEWFKDAQKGDLDKLNYFVVSEEEPEKKVYKDEKIGYIAEYKHDLTTISKRRLIFPEITETHYRKENINGKDYYLYHTFYPFQLDINWKNPEVLYYNLRTIAFWANLGIDIFRMDAIPYLIKEDGTNAENLPKTHEIVKILSTFLQETAPRSVIQVEACQPPRKLLPYFGTERTININIDDKTKELTRTNEAQIAYHFPYMPAIWATLVSGDNKYFWKTHRQTPQIPDSASWAIFLRVHDELTLEMVNKETRELLYEDLADKGAEFRKGYGISGRMADFLDNNPDRINMAFAILLSLKGIPIIYYGDEIGSRNNFSYAQRWAKIRERKNKSKNGEKTEMLSYFDSRDIHRGAIKRNTFYRAMYRNNNFKSRIYKKVKRLIEVRKNYPTISRGDFTEIKTNKSEVFSYLRTGKYDKILMLNNLSESKIFAEINISDLGLNNENTLIKMTELITKEEKTFKIEDKKIVVRLKPYETMWLSFK